MTLKRICCIFSIFLGLFPAPFEGIAAGASARVCGPDPDRRQDSPLLPGPARLEVRLGPRQLLRQPGGLLQGAQDHDRQEKDRKPFQQIQR